jgi:Na+-driven multidrug efflux pump
MKFFTVFGLCFFFCSLFSQAAYAQAAYSQPFSSRSIRLCQSLVPVTRPHKVSDTNSLGVWIAMGADFFVRGISYYLRWIRGKWQEKRVITN